MDENDEQDDVENHADDSIEESMEEASRANEYTWEVIEMAKDEKISEVMNATEIMEATEVAEAEAAEQSDVEINKPEWLGNT